MYEKGIKIRIRRFLNLELRKSGKEKS